MCTCDTCLLQWGSEFGQSPLYEAGDKVCNVRAEDLGYGFAIYVDVKRGETILHTSPYFSSGKEGYADSDAADEDEHAFLRMMAGATDWHAGEWTIEGSEPL